VNDSEETRVEKFKRNSANSWQLIDYRSIDLGFSLNSLPLEIDLATVYNDGNFK
jgi:hypothetical protein